MSFLYRCIWESIKKKVLQRAGGTLIPGGDLSCAEVAGEHLDECSLLWNWWMDGWMSGWMDRWTDEWLDGWID